MKLNLNSFSKLNGNLYEHTKKEPQKCHDSLETTRIHGNPAVVAFTLDPWLCVPIFGLVCYFLFISTFAIISHSE